MNKYPQIFANNGPLVSSQYWSDADRTDTEVYFHHYQKAEIMMTVGSSWYGGDFMEFGSGDLNTFRDFLTAYNICGMTRQYPDVKFFAFDIFGKLEEDVGDLKTYFDPYTVRGDSLPWHQTLLNNHGLYVDKCQLVQGLFHNTLTKGFKEAWRSDKVASIDYSETALHLPSEYRNSATRQIGFASLDCNVPSSYKTVFEYMQSPEVMAMWRQFKQALFVKRNMKAVYIRNAGGFGSLYRLYPVVEGNLAL